MFRDLIPLLADRFHIVAPDLPGFGQSDVPPREKFSYTFDNIAGVIDRFTEVMGFYGGHGIRSVCRVCL
jgi:pimeloyl-ACP methyl ester carboxylesterase